MNINDFINSIDNKLYNRIRQSKRDAECRRYLKEHLEAITVTHCCKSDSELLFAFLNWLDYGLKEDKEYCINTFLNEIVSK